MSKFDPKSLKGSVPNGQSKFLMRDAIRWFKCKLKPPNNFTIPRNTSSPSSFNNFNKRNSLCDHYHSILCTVCSSSRPTLHTEAHLLHQPPGVVAQVADNPVHQGPTHCPSSPIEAPTTGRPQWSALHPRRPKSRPQRCVGRPQCIRLKRSIQ